MCSEQQSHNRNLSREHAQVEIDQNLADQPTLSFETGSSTAEMHSVTVLCNVWTLAVLQCRQTGNIDKVASALLRRHALLPRDVLARRCLRRGMLSELVISSSNENVTAHTAVAEYVVQGLICRLRHYLPRLLLPTVASTRSSKGIDRLVRRLCMSTWSIQR